MNFFDNDLAFLGTNILINVSSFNPTAEIEGDDKPGLFNSAELSAKSWLANNSDL